MVYLILGNNAYVADQEIKKLERSLGLISERVDLDSLDSGKLADIMRGGSLFSEKRLIVCSGLSSRKDLWEKCAAWIDDVSKDTTIVLVESKLDRRTKTAKSYLKAATLIKADRWRDKDHERAEEWLRSLAKAYHVGLSPQQVSNMVARGRVVVDGENFLEIDQYMIAKALSSLRGIDHVTDEMVATVLPPAVEDSVFDLLSFAVKRQSSRLLRLLDELRLSDEPQRVFALIATQWAQLAALSLGVGATATLATELGVHPYVAQKLRELATDCTAAQIREITSIAAAIDVGMKCSQFDPWDGVERLLFAIVQR